ncbi:1429_t:CDS:2 [Ambispora leptoticha]|uniref:1429_t:CDS:1 n=1 Tax=Ambispora leptoticha TaxID=144679 RepID=A0A9N8WAZ0_9GLOM|nr:1429_t:CDS:2 [Ambispora leptoticha]
MSNSEEFYKCVIDPLDSSKIICNLNGRISDFRILNKAECFRGKRPLNSFMLFRCNLQDEIKGVNVPEISSRAKKLWAVATEDVKKRFKDLSKRSRESWNRFQFVESKIDKKDKRKSKKLNMPNTGPIAIPPPHNPTKNDNNVKLNEDIESHNKFSAQSSSNSFNSTGDSFRSGSFSTPPFSTLSFTNSMVPNDQYSVSILSSPLSPSSEALPPLSIPSSSNSSNGSWIFGSKISEPNINYQYLVRSFQSENNHMNDGNFSQLSILFNSNDGSIDYFSLPRNYLVPNDTQSFTHLNKAADPKQPFEPDRRQDKKRKEADEVHNLIDAQPSSAFSSSVLTSPAQLQYNPEIYQNFSFSTF